MLAPRPGVADQAIDHRPSTIDHRPWTTRIITFLAGFCFTLTIQAQDFSRNNWYFTGNDQALIFGKEVEGKAILSPGKSPQRNSGEKVTVTDPTSGELIFYTDGINLYDGTHRIMTSGTGILTEDTGIQVLSASPVPGNKNLFYLFHKNEEGEILYTLVDKSKPGNRSTGPPAGSVVQKNASTGITARGNGMITIGAKDGSRFWLVSQNAKTGLFEIHKIPESGGTFEGVGNLNLTTRVETLHLSYHQATGLIAIIPSNNANIQIVQFSESGPTLTFSRMIPNSFVPGETFGGAAGCSFSGDYLYFSRNSDKKGNLYRFNIEKAKDNPSVETVLPEPTGKSLSLLLAPDSTLYHIYRDKPGGNHSLARINQPDEAIKSIEYEKELFEELDVKSAYFSQFAPRAKPEITVTIAAQSGDFCKKNPIQFFARIHPPTVLPTEYSWDFGPLGKSEQLAPIMTFEKAGPVTARLTVTINGEKITSNALRKQIKDNDIQVSLKDTTICKGEELELDATPKKGKGGGSGGGIGIGGGGSGSGGGSYQYLWNTGEKTAKITVSESGNYWVVVTPSKGCPVYASARVKVYGDKSTTANIWYFGKGAGIDFNEEKDKDPPPRSIAKPHPMDAPEGTSTISDANGDVLFYAHGDIVWNRENKPMPNGTEIGGEVGATQSVTIIPIPDDKTRYYLFTTQEVYGSNTFELKYSMVDMKGDKGLGDVVLKDTVLFTRSTEKLAAFKGGKGFWLLAHEYGSNSFRTYPVTKDGIGVPVISSAGAIHSFNDALSGQAGMKFSADGKRVAVALIEGGNDYVELFEFDPETGEVTEFEYRIDLNEGGTGSDEVYDVHFSPGGGKLFATLNNRNGSTPGGRILEYRVDSRSTAATRLKSRADIAESAKLSVNFGQIQTGPNGQLYVAVETPGNAEGSKFISAIAANEDTLKNSTLNPKAVELKAGNSRLGLPNFVQNNANPQEKPSMNVEKVACTGKKIKLTSKGTSEIDEFLWSITNRATRKTIFTAAKKDTSFTFPKGKGGLYNISVNISNRCGFDTTLVQKMEVLDAPARPSVPKALSICEGKKTALDAIKGKPDDPGLRFQWTNSQGAVVSTSRNYTIEKPEIYTVTITNIAGCNSSAKIFAGPPFEIKLPDARTICQGSELTLDPGVTASNYQWTVLDKDNKVVEKLKNKRRAAVNTEALGVFRYVVAVEDPISPGCFVNDTTTVTISALPQAKLGSTKSPSACGNPDGFFDFSISTKGSYTYEVTGSSSGAVKKAEVSGPTTKPVAISGLKPGIYRVKLTDNSSGCVHTLKNIEVQDDAAGFTISKASPADAACSSTTGAIKVTLDKNVFPVNYTLTNRTTMDKKIGKKEAAITGTSFDFELKELPAGTYDLEVISAGCMQNKSGIVIKNPKPVTIKTEPFVEKCGTTTPLLATSTAAGATFSWKGPDGFSATGASVSAPESGVYTVKAEATGSCPASQKVVVEMSIQPLVKINSSGKGCNGAVTLTAEVTNPQPGTRYIYNWSNGANTKSITVNKSDTYEVTARISTNLDCHGKADKKVSIPVPIRAIVSSTPACDNDSPVTLSVEVLSGNPTNFVWTKAGKNVGSGKSIEVTEEGTYRVKISDGACFIQKSTEIKKQAVPKGLLPEVAFYCPNRTNNPVLLAGRGFATYQWTRDGQPFGKPFEDEVQKLKVTGPGQYEVTMTTATGCVRKDEVKVIESCDPRVVAPNAMRPSSAAPNNTFRVFPNDFVANFEIFIYSRWGELIFYSNSVEFQWDGTVNGQLVQGGTYPYVIRFTSRFEPQRGTFEQKGAVRVLR